MSEAVEGGTHALCPGSGFGILKNNATSTPGFFVVF